MNEEIDYTKLSKEELISLLRNQEKARLDEVEKLNKSNQELNKNNQELIYEIERLSSEKKELEEQVKLWKAKYEYQLAKEKKGNLERFVTKADNAYKTAQERRIYSRKKIPPTNDPDATKRKKAQRIYSKEELRELAKGNEIYTNDILPELMAEHPDWHFEKIGEDETYILERVKAHIVVHLVSTPKYISKEQRGVIYQNESISPIPHSNVGPSLLADICTAKFQFGMPVFRYHNWINGCGFEFSLRTLYGYIMKGAELLEGIYNNIESSIRTGNCSCLGIDETYLKVIEAIGDEREHCYVYVINGEPDGHKIRFFKYTGSRNSDYVKNLLKDYKGTIVVDGYSGYDKMPEGISKQRCLCHLRRKFADIVKTLDDDKKKDSVAYGALKLIDKIFENERIIKDKKLDPMDVLKERNSKDYLADVDAFKKYVEDTGFVEHSPLGEAMNYYFNGGDDFFTFLSCGDIPLDNNMTERACKMFATNRRGFLFCRNDDGARAASILTTVIKTAEANGLYPDEYLNYVFSHTHNTSASNLMPWSDGVRDNPKLIIKKKK
jgi:hypothetical protein